MQHYQCDQCDKLICNNSICPVCGNKTQLIEMSIYYCNHCNCPTFDEECEICHNKCIKIGSDIRPVFAQERLLLEVLEGNPFKYVNSSFWCTGSNNYVIDGKKVKFSFQ